MKVIAAVLLTLLSNTSTAKGRAAGDECSPDTIQGLWQCKPLLLLLLLRSVSSFFHSSSSYACAHHSQSHSELINVFFLLLLLLLLLSLSLSL